MERDERETDRREGRRERVRERRAELVVDEERVLTARERPPHEARDGDRSREREDEREALKRRVLRETGERTARAGREKCAEREERAEGEHDEQDRGAESGGGTLDEDLTTARRTADRPEVRGGERETEEHTAEGVEPAQVHRRRGYTRPRAASMKRPGAMGREQVDEAHGADDAPARGVCDRAVGGDGWRCGMDRKGRGLTRRELLRLAGAGATTSLLGCGDDGVEVDGGALDAAIDDGSVDGSEGFDAGSDAGSDAGTDAGERPPGDPESLPESTEFGLGVASGDVRLDRAVLWTRYDGGASLRVRVWRMEGAEYVALVHEATVTPADGGFVHVDVPLPVAGARYRFAFVEGEGEAEARSTIGRFRAALDESTLAPLVIGAVSCTRNGRAFPTLERAGARDDFDLFLLLGDTTYADGAVSLADYREKWTEVLDTDGYRALRAATSLHASWDDHEVDNNWDPERIAADQIRAATDAFFEHTPVRRIEGAPDRIWRSARWGRTLELFVLDCRAERLPSTRRSDGATYVSRAQLDWLKAGLASSTAVFKLVVNSVGITDFPLLLDAGSADRWEGYDAQREELLRFVDESDIDGLLWIAGDFHFACLGHVGRAEGELGWNQWEVLAGPGAQIANPLWTTCNAPQFTYATGTNNFTELALDPTSGEITIRWIDGEGTAIATRTIQP